MFSNMFPTASYFASPGLTASARTAKDIQNRQKVFTSGIDKNGKGYIYDKSTNKMLYYGAANNEWNSLASRLSSQGYRRVWEGDNSPQQKQGQKQEQLPDSNITGGGGGGGYVAPPKVLDEAELRSIDSFLASLDTTRSQARKQAALRRDEAKNKKEDEFGREEGKYEGKKLSTLQEFGGTKTDTDINTRNALENLVSSLSTMGLGGSRALTRKILAAANISNRKANATQATNNRELDSVFNEYKGGYESDLDKIGDQYQYEVGKADQDWGKERRNALYKKANVYGEVDRNDDRAKYMREGDQLNSFINKAAFMNPKYTGKTRVMDTPELADYTQDIAQYDTSAIGAAPADGLTPVGADGTTAPGNLAVRAIAVNDRDLGVKKKTEGELAYGV